jgi:deazaflavin-dependent oxidoreductase (nitroreductase family)
MNTSTIKMPGTPPRWVNGIVSVALRIPGLRQVAGRAFALITVTGAVSGHSYTTPVQYIRNGDVYVVLSQRKRRWWRNIETNRAVRLLVRGDDIAAHASIASGDASRSLLVDCLTQQPRIAKFYGIPIRQGVPDDPGIAELAAHVVTIVIEPDSGVETIEGIAEP